MPSRLPLHRKHRSSRIVEGELGLEDGACRDAIPRDVETFGVAGFLHVAIDYRGAGDALFVSRRNFPNSAAACCRRLTNFRRRATREIDRTGTPVALC